MNIDRPDWQTEAACRSMGPDVFFPEVVTVQAIATARAVCADCPAKPQCLDDALSRAYVSDYGLWAGTTRADRRTLRRQRTHETTPDLEHAA